MKFKGSLLYGIVIAFAILGGGARAQAQDHDHHDHDADSEEGHHHGLHFAHPLIGESITPDTKVRLEHEFEHFRHGDGHGQTFTLEGEYAFVPGLSMEIDAPVGVVSPSDGSQQSAFGNLTVALKLTNKIFAERGVLLGYGIEFGFPTGNDSKGIGSNHILTYEPYLDAGYKNDKVEVSGFARFGIPTRQKSSEAVDTEFEYNVSTVYHASPHVQGVLELDGGHTLSGFETESAAHVTPGIKYRPNPTGPVILGFGVSLPVTSTSESDVRTNFSAFYHFE